MKKQDKSYIGLSGCYSECTNCSSESKCCSSFDKINLPVLNKNEMIKIREYTKSNNFYVSIAKNIYTLNTVKNKCVFYKNGKCSIYEVRPIDCKLFPFDVIRINQRYYLIIYELDCINIKKFVNQNYCDEDLIKKVIPWIKDFTNDINYTKMKKYKFKIIKEIKIESIIE